MYFNSKLCFHPKLTNWSVDLRRKQNFESRHVARNFLRGGPDFIRGAHHGEKNSFFPVPLQAVFIPRGRTGPLPGPLATSLFQSNIPMPQYVYTLIPNDFIL